MIKKKSMNLLNIIQINKWCNIDVKILYHIWLWKNRSVKLTIVNDWIFNHSAWLFHQLNDLQWNFIYFNVILISQYRGVYSLHAYYVIIIMLCPSYRRIRYTIAFFAYQFQFSELKKNLKTIKNLPII